jgi:hypothetical protein
MDGGRLARTHRAIRRRLKWRQEDVSVKAGVGRWKIVRLEAGDMGDLKLDELDRCFSALGARLRVTVDWHGAALDRLLDETHAQLVAAVLEVLHQYGWQSRVEVTFSEYGERGSIDILAWHPAEAVLLVVEIKSELGGIDPLLRPLNIKVRLASKIAAREFGWRTSRPVSCIVVLPEDSSARRAVERHAGVFDRTLPARSRDIRRWLRQPTDQLAGIWFLSAVGQDNVTRNPSAIRRVRRASPRTPPLG